MPLVAGAGVVVFLELEAVAAVLVVASSCEEAGVDVLVVVVAEREESHH